MSDDIHFKLTEYGFEYGGAIVERLAHYKGAVYLEIRTKRQKFLIKVTAKNLIIPGQKRNLRQLRMYEGEK